MSIDSFSAQSSLRVPQHDHATLHSHVDPPRARLLPRVGTASCAWGPGRRTRKQDSNVQQVELRPVERYDAMAHRRLLCFVGWCAWTRNKQHAAIRRCPSPLVHGTRWALPVSKKHKCNTGWTMRISDTSTGDRSVGVASNGCYPHATSPLEAACIMQEHSLVHACATNVHGKILHGS